MKEAFRQHLRSAGDLETTREAYRAGFIALALEKNHRATPFVERARALKAAASRAGSAAELLDMDDIRERWQDLPVASRGHRKLGQRPRR